VEGASATASVTEPATASSEEVEKMEAWVRKSKGGREGGWEGGWEKRKHGTWSDLPARRRMEERAS